MSVSINFGGKMTKISVSLPGLNLKNPVMPASGTFGFGDVAAAKKFDLNELGAVVLKTATLKSRLGNPQPQVAVLGTGGVLNSVGLTNPGAKVVAQEKLPALREQYPDLPIIASVGGGDKAEYVAVAQILASSQPNALEINFSCPNVARGGMTIGVQPELVESITAAIKQSVDLPVYVKLTPNVTDITIIAQAAAAGGADGLSLINTVMGLEINLKSRKPVLGNNVGGLSGSGIKPLALYQVQRVRKVTDLPIIGMGGITTAQDVAEFMLAGANAVAVGSAHFNDPLACVHIIQKLPQVLSDLGVSDINDLVGQVSFN